MEPELLHRLVDLPRQAALSLGELLFLVFLLGGSWSSVTGWILVRIPSVSDTQRVRHLVDAPKSSQRIPATSSWNRSKKLAK